MKNTGYDGYLGPRLSREAQLRRIRRVMDAELTEAQLTEGSIAILDLMLACKLAPSKSEARRLVQQGGVFANDEKVASIDVRFTAEQLKAGVIMRKGKKVFHKAVL